MIKPEYEAREDRADDVWYEIEKGNRFMERGSRINLSAIQDYASIGLKPPAISAIMGLGRNVIYQSTPMRAAYEKGRAILNIHVMERSLRNMDGSPAILGKWMDAFGVGGEETPADDSDDGDQAVDVRISFPKKPKAE